MTRDSAIAQIAAILHHYNHPTYDTVSFCVFCHAIAVHAVGELTEEEEGSS